MKYLTFESEGNNPICVIKESKDKKLKNKIIYSDDKSKSVNSFNDMAASEVIRIFSTYSK